MDAIIRVLAKEVGRDAVTVNQVAPGWTISNNDRANGNADADSEASRAYIVSCTAECARERRLEWASAL
eukprot:SAG11_NODE_2895_length_2856_cov_2.924946_3_plen_69_part_00